MLVELVEVKKKKDAKYTLQKIYLNPKHIVYITEDTRMPLLLENDNLGLMDGVSFSKIKINHEQGGDNITVVGTPELIESKIFKNSTRKILRG